MTNLWRSNFFIKLRSWEYWPFGVVYAPIFAYWLWLSLKARSLFFFSASNPGIENGGMLGESKIKILNNIPDHLKPETLLITSTESVDQALTKLSASNLKYPIIAKPDVGERGWKVEIIKSEEELHRYVQNAHIDFLLQELIDLPIELGVFYYRYPTRNKGKVSSIVSKEMLSVTGTGQNTLEELILNHDRSKLQYETLELRFSDQMNEVLPLGEVLVLETIGNHCRGTKFLNGNHLINNSLNYIFDKISKQIDGFYYGRFDLKVNSIEDLYAGNIKIMELNGAGAEPAHIYQPGFPFWKGLEALFGHWKVLYEISKENHKLGIPYLSFSEARTEYARIKALHKPSEH